MENNHGGEKIHYRYEDRRCVHIKKMYRLTQVSKSQGASLR